MQTEELGLRVLAVSVCFLLTGDAAAESATKLMARTEAVYADAVDAITSVETIDSGLVSRYGGRDRHTWERVYSAKRREFLALAAKFPKHGLPENETRALAAMRGRIEGSPSLERTQNSLKPSGRCKDAARKDLNYALLRDTLYACFDQIGDDLEFEGRRLTRFSALDMLERIEEPERRKKLFLAFVPLWQAINGDDHADSPYRRLMGIAAAEAAKNGSPIENAARAAGVSSEQIEGWLQQILNAWHEANADRTIEPWDFHYRYGEADRVLEPFISRDALQPVAERYYRDLGADLRQMGVLYDLDPRPGKAPLAYSDFARAGRMVHGHWLPTVPRVSASYARGGLGALNELIHENGHAVHYAALRTRPAFMDLELLFAEAFADVPSWSAYEPAWQRKYLGHEASESSSLRSGYSGVMLDVAWSLFEIRMLRNPAADPNALWTEITSRFLGIAPHPEWSWWAVRVQLVESPGYMVNYGLGAVLTAEIRRHIRESLGSFETGDPRWYGWVSERLLRYGTERETAALMREFLGRPVSPGVLIEEIRRLRKN